MLDTIAFVSVLCLAAPADAPEEMQWEELDEPEAPASPEPGEQPTPDAPPPGPAPPEAGPSSVEAPAEAPAQTPPAEPDPEATPEPLPAQTSPAEAAPVIEREPDPPTEPEPEQEVSEREIAGLEPPASPELSRREKPSLYGRLWAGPVLGAGRNLIALGASATYFIIPYFGLGAELVNVFRWGPFDSYYEFQFTPRATVLLLPRRRVSPLFWGGFGVDTFNKDLGTYGRWTTGGGLIMLLGRRVILTVGVEFDGRVPKARWNRTFACGPIAGDCTIGIGPALGLAIPFG